MISENYEKVKRFYDEGTWPEKRVGNAVQKGWITPQEYELITGQRYE